MMSIWQKETGRKRPNFMREANMLADRVETRVQWLAPQP